MTKIEGKCLTDQSFRDEANINSIVRRYNSSGILVDPFSVNSGRLPNFGDFSETGDFRSAQNKLLEAKKLFLQLPSKLRAEFSNDVGVFLDFVSTADYEQLVEKGLAAKIHETPDGKKYTFDADTGKVQFEPAKNTDTD